MTWGRLDDSFAFHPKILAAGNEAAGAFVRMIACSCYYLTDGRVSSAMARQIATKRVLQKLVDVVLLHPTEHGYDIHDFDQYNPTGDEVDARREDLRMKRSEAGKKGAARRWQKPYDASAKVLMATNVLPSVLPHGKDDTLPSAPLANGSQTDGPVPVPDPRLKTHGRGRGNLDGLTRTRGTRALGEMAAKSEEPLPAASPDDHSEPVLKFSNGRTEK